MLPGETQLQRNVSPKICGPVGKKQMSGSFFLCVEIQAVPDRSDKQTVWMSSSCWQRIKGAGK